MIEFNEMNETKSDQPKGVLVYLLLRESRKSKKSIISFNNGLSLILQPRRQIGRASCRERV